MIDIAYLIEWQRADPGMRTLEITAKSSEPAQVWMYDLAVMAGGFISIGDPIPDFVAIRVTKDREQFEALKKKFEGGD